MPTQKIKTPSSPELVAKVKQGAILYPKTLRLIPLDVQRGILAFMLYEKKQQEWHTSTKRKGITQKGLLEKVQAAAKENRGRGGDNLRHRTSCGRDGVPKFYWENDLYYEGAQLVGVVRTVLNLPKIIVLEKDPATTPDMFEGQGVEYNTPQPDAVAFSKGGKELRIERRGKKADGYGQN